MVVMIFAALLILGIAFYQTVQGLFSAMIMAVLTVLCAAAALNYYEPLANLLIPRLGVCAHSAALLGLFVIPLLVVRILFDRLIPGNVMLGLWPDRIGGAAFGLLTALVLTGMLTIVVQMLPLPATILTYQPYDQDLAVKQGGPPKLAADFTLWMTGQLAGGSLRPFGPGRSFAATHDDLLRDAYALRNRPDGATVWAKPDAMEVLAATTLVEPPRGKPPTEYTRAEADRNRIVSATPRNPLIPPLVSTKVLLVRVKVDQSAREERTNWYLLPGTHFRLTTDQGGSYYPVGYLTYAGTWRVNTVTVEGEKPSKARLGDILVARPWTAAGPGQLIVDWLFRIPADQTPSTLYFRRTCAVRLPPAIEGEPPRAIGDKGQLALSIKAVRGEVKFEAPAAAGYLQPDHMSIDNALPENISVPRLTPEQTPPVLKRAEFEGNGIKSVLLDGNLADLGRQFGDRIQYANRFYVPSQNQALLQVFFKVPQGARLDGEARALLRDMKPTVLLDDNTSIPPAGAWTFFGSGAQREVYFYYDAAQARPALDPDFVEALRSHTAPPEFIALAFIVPNDPNRNVVAVRLGPQYEFQPTAPMISVPRY